MFSSMVNYLFGSLDESTAEEGSRDLKMKDTEEGDWTLVDDENKNNDGADAMGIRPGGGLDNAMRQCAEVVNVVNIHDGDNSPITNSQTDSELNLRVGDLSDSDTVLSDISSVPEMVAHLSLDEAWLVTPPPCFTEGERSIKGYRPNLSNIENLLIENPNMAILKSKNRKRSLSSSNTESCRSRSSSNDGVMTRGMAHRARKAVRRELEKRLTEKEKVASTGRSRTLASEISGMMSQAKNIKYMQAQKRVREDRGKQRNKMDRSNKVQHYKSSTRQQKRKNKMAKPSGANNNRKRHS